MQAFPSTSQDSITQTLFATGLADVMGIIKEELPTDHGDPTLRQDMEAMDRCIQAMQVNFPAIPKSHKLAETCCLRRLCYNEWSLPSLHALIVLLIEDTRSSSSVALLMIDRAVSCANRAHMLLLPCLKFL